MANCKELLVALTQSVDEPQIGIFNLYSEEDYGDTIEEQIGMFFGAVACNSLEPGQYLYSYGIEYHGEGWSSDAKLVSSMDGTIYLYKIGDVTE